MEDHEFLNSAQHFNQVIALHAEHHLWEKLAGEIPHLPKGWYELARLPLEYRIEFTRDYWLSCLPVTDEAEDFLDDFFCELEEIEIFATQVSKGDAFDVHMVYSLKEHAGFFQGAPPASGEKLETLIQQFSAINFPEDYLAFLRIHDGFSKYTDTGLIKTRDMPKVYQKLQMHLAHEVLVRPDGITLDHARLIPFYESYLHCYQCFYADWYPEKDMGNVHFSENDSTMSNFLDPHRLKENLAFPTFVDWLLFYLDDV